ncbi:helix-turn-helix domain-containing protein [Aureimonas frigidaquae]|uniref:helix-turn-helix domain-containing protein n=1 Tax=Aureimonas frigidaquae TaxID=424757 RepID=UPI000A74F3BF|nr:helix-turn-helix domain-containing protein [Aureimonas frigidaquae]
MRMNAGPAEAAGLVTAGKDGWSMDDTACALAVAISSAFCEQPEDEIACRARCRAATSDARHIAIYLAHVVFQRPRRVIAEAFQRDRTTIAHALSRVEDRRDDPAFDALVTRMEHVAKHCRALIPDGAR